MVTVMMTAMMAMMTVMMMMMTPTAFQEFKQHMEERQTFVREAGYDYSVGLRSKESVPMLTSCHLEDGWTGMGLGAIFINN